jgi:hypothetical protein
MLPACQDIGCEHGQRRRVRALQFLASSGFVQPTTFKYQVLNAANVTLTPTVAEPMPGLRPSDCLEEDLRKWTSFPKVELKAQSICDFFDAPLKAD